MSSTPNSPTTDADAEAQAGADESTTADVGDQYIEADELSDAEYIHQYHEVSGVPSGFRLGERTQQSVAHPPADWKDDFFQMRMKFGVEPFEVENYTEKSDACVVYPDVIRHRLDPEKTPTTKATDALISGKKNAGKTTYLSRLSIRLGEVNDERIVYRGRMDDSGWQTLRWWTTLWLPERAGVDATWVYEQRGDRSREPVDDLEDVVRDVRYYEDVVDLVDKLGDAPVPSFNVVYPDPSFAGCERVMLESNKTGEVLPYTPAWEADDNASPTPLPQWWIAFLLAQLEHGHFDAFMSWICDEAHQVFGPANPSQDDHKTDKKFDLAGQLLNEARKRMLSWYLTTQSEGKIDYRILREVTTRIQLADGRPNPVKDRQSTHPYGFEIVPMDVDFLSNRDSPGRGLCYVEGETGFAEFTWDVPEPHPDDENRWLKISLGQPRERTPGQTNTSTSARAHALEYDEQFFDLHEPSGRLYVRQPGAGEIDVTAATIDEELEAPPADEFDDMAELEFHDTLRRSDDDEAWIVTGEVGIPDSQGRVQTMETTFVRIPESGFDPSSHEVEPK